MKLLNWLGASLLVAVLAACGGGGGSSGGTTNGSVAPPTGGNTTTVADFQAILSKTALTNAANDSVTLNVLALNAANNAVQGAAVSVAVDSQAVFIGTGSVTGNSGAFTGQITTPANKANRSINVTVTVGSIVKTLVLPVVGSQITITPVPGAPSINAATQFNISLLDAAGSAIANSDLTIGGTFGYSGVQPRTNLNGDASFTTNAPAIAGTYNLTVSASGVTATRQISVVGGVGAPVVPPALQIVSGSLNASPANIRQNLSANATNKSEIRFLMVNQTTNIGIENVRVKFSLLRPLGGGERLSTGDQIVLSNSSGIATTDYIAGLRTSPTNGVEVRACYAATDSELAGNLCPNPVITSLTVGGEAVSLSITSENLLSRANGNALYRQRVVVQVGDSAGNAVAGAAISASIDITHYGKGIQFGSRYPRTVLGSATAVYVVTTPPNITDTYTSGTLGNNELTNPNPTFRVWCINEDRNRNGNLDAGEDIDNDGVLEPRRSEVVIIPVGNGVTDANGVAEFFVQWGQDVGTWLAYTVKATARVSGSEGTNSKPFITDVLQADLPNGTFLVPPYGAGNCSTNN